MYEIFLILGLIILNGLFSMAEIALVSARKARLEAQAAKGSEEARRALDLANNPDTFLSTVQIGITLIGILTGIFSGEKLKDDFVVFFNKFETTAPYSSGLATTILVIIITYFSLVIGELLPKRIGLSRPETIAKRAAGPMRIISIITYPFIWLLSNSTNVLAKLLNIKTNDNQVTEEEIKAIINEGTEHGAIEEAEQEIIERVFHLGDRNITSLMTHRKDIHWMDINSTIGDAKEKAKEYLHSMYPVCDGQVDNIKGYITIKDLFIAANDNATIESLMHQAMYVPENNSAYQVLEKFKVTKKHHCFIVDEYGSVEGLITLNDILEAIVGDMPEPESDEYEIVEREDGTYLVDALLPFYDLLSYFNKTEWIDEEQDYDTLAGFVIHELERIPQVGDKLEWKDLVFEIIDMDGHKVDKILLTVPDNIKEEMED